MSRSPYRYVIVITVIALCLWIISVLHQAWHTTTTTTDQRTTSITTSSSTKHHRFMSLLSSSSLSCDVFIMVMTRASSLERRHVVRSTWGSHLPINYILRFFVGSNVTHGIQQESDVVVLHNYIDNYQNLNMKRIHAMKWIVTRYQPRYVIKTDDDVYLNIPVVTQRLQGLPDKQLYLGYMLHNRPVLRDPAHSNSDFHLPAEMTHYPPFASGAGYIMSLDVVQFLASPMLPPIQLTNDDSSIGVALVYSNVTYIHDASIFPRALYEGHCVMASDVMLLHYVTPQDIINIHDAFITNQEYCGHEPRPSEQFVKAHPDWFT